MIISGIIPSSWDSTGEEKSQKNILKISNKLIVKTKKKNIFHFLYFSDFSTRDLRGGRSCEEFESSFFPKVSLLAGSFDLNSSIGRKRDIFYTKGFAFFYTEIFAFLQQYFAFFYNKIYAFLQQHFYFFTTKFCFFTTKCMQQNLCFTKMFTLFTPNFEF